MYYLVLTTHNDRGFAPDRACHLFLYAVWAAGAGTASCTGTAFTEGSAEAGEFFEEAEESRVLAALEARRFFSILFAAFTSRTPLATFVAAPAKPPTTYPPAATPLASNTPPPVTIACKEPHDGS